VLHGDAPARSARADERRDLYGRLTGGRKTGLFTINAQPRLFGGNLVQGKRCWMCLHMFGGSFWQRWQMAHLCGFAVDGVCSGDWKLASRVPMPWGYRTVRKARQGDAFDILTALRARVREFMS